MCDMDETPLPQHEVKQASQVDKRLPLRLRVRHTSLWSGIKGRLRPFAKYDPSVNAIPWIRQIGADFLSAQQSEHTLYQHAPVPLTISKRYYAATRRVPAAPPSISIVTPSFNQGRFVERTIRSVLAQQYPNLEYIIQDGASTDNTMQIVDTYQPYLKHVASGKDSGQAQAINLGFRHATGDIMAWLNSDDMLLPGTVAYVVDFFRRHPEVDVVYGHRIHVDAHDHEVGCRVMPAHDAEILRWVDYIPQETLFWRRRLWEKVGGQLDESYQFALDWELLLRFQAAGARFVRLPRFMGAFRVHAASKTVSWHDVGQQEVNHLRTQLHGHPVSDAEVQRRIRVYVQRLAWGKLLYRCGWLRH
jgi:GT2 family glycosyltransferase